MQTLLTELVSRMHLKHIKKNLLKSCFPLACAVAVTLYKLLVSYGNDLPSNI